MLRVPDDFKLHPRVSKIWAERRKMAQGDQLANWGFAENLAYATLVDAGYPVRLSGQDAGRGTFFHRHAKVHCQDTGATTRRCSTCGRPRPGAELHRHRLHPVRGGGARLRVRLRHRRPNALTIWEAQFGDFANGAQVVIDQFITSAGTKWGLTAAW
jgi:2-oxoglutarate dehydrogenase E1 component